MLDVSGMGPSGVPDPVPDGTPGTQEFPPQTALSTLPGLARASSLGPFTQGWILWLLL